MLTSQIVAAVQGEGISPSDALAVVNERYIRANAEARWRKSSAQITTTVAGQANYALDPAIIDIDHIRIGTNRYFPVSQQTIWDYQAEGVTLTDGVFAPDFESGDQIEFYPPPTTTGDPIMAIRVIEPALLTLSPDSTPIFPTDLHGPILIDGSIATIRARTDERLQSASYFEQIYANGVRMLKLRANSRVGGNRPRRVALYGRDFV